MRRWRLCGPFPHSHVPHSTGSRYLFRRKDIVFLVGCIGVIALVAPFDQAITDRMTDPALRERLLPVLGLALASFLFGFLLIVLGAAKNRWRLILGFLTPVLGSSLITHALKAAVGRARPDAGQGHWHFEPAHWFQYIGSMESFPSGHATTAAALAVLLGLYFPRWRYAFWVIAGCVALERVVSNRHYLSDTLAGAGIGVASVLLCMLIFGRDAYRLEFGANLEPSPKRPADLQAVEERT